MTPRLRLYARTAFAVDRPYSPADTSDPSIGAPSNRTKACWILFTCGPRVPSPHERRHGRGRLPKRYRRETTVSAGARRVLRVESSSRLFSIADSCPPKVVSAQVIAI
jgi:hypothetical protein